MLSDHQARELIQEVRALRRRVASLERQEFTAVGEEAGRSAYYRPDDGSLRAPGDVLVDGRLRVGSGTPDAPVYVNQGSDGDFVHLRDFSSGRDFVIRLNGDIYEIREELSGGGDLWLALHPNGGVVIGAAADGSQGPGTLNAQAVYDDGSLLSDWLFDLWIDGETDDEHAPTDGRIWPVPDVERFVRERRHLPWLPGREQWMKKRSSLGELVTGLWETVEQQQLQIFELQQRVAALEGGMETKEKS